ncbi:MAG: Malate-2H(+)/Na(+)-lactate antiporter [Flavobacteriaceae bacterium]|nr:MAG: Malate-2H(+)/Na(+)-lactate antiporter [Flavobacteriaceae bacterium]
MKSIQPISLTLALTPLVLLVILLGINVFYFGDASLDGSNQFILLIGGFLAALVGFYQKVSYEDMMDAVSSNLKSTSGSLLILLMVGALSGSWLISGIIPSMIFYGIKILNPTVFLAASVVICALISVATGSSWTTSATVGIALIGVGNAMGVPVGMTAGAIISGAYFGDKMSPLSDTTNLAPVMAGGELFSHIRYMTYTTVPSIVITLIVFIVLSLGLEVNGAVETESLNAAIQERFFISPILFIVPVLVVFMIVKKTPPLIALLAGTLLGGVVALIFQPSLVASITGADSLNLENGYKGMLTAFTTDVSISTSNEALNDLFNSGGMAGMLGTIWLIVCAMVFGGVMEAIGALNRITQSLLSLAQSTFGLFASTVASCLAINLTASDQYLAIVVPGKMFSKAYKDRGLAPENLSRTLEDSGTVTSALIPWNTCGAYHSSVLGVPVFEYFIFAVFNYVSPFVTLTFAALNIKIKQLRA